VSYTRALKYELPMVRGNDVLELQLALRQQGKYRSGQPDGLFGTVTESAVREFQREKGLTVDGWVGEETWNALFAASAPIDAIVKADPVFEKIKLVLDELKEPHAFSGGVSWQLTGRGVAVAGGTPETSGGGPETVKRVWSTYRDDIDRWSVKYGVPAELVIATICTESGGNPIAKLKEPGYVSDRQTPHKISVGLMQTLIATARDTLRDDQIDQAWLLEPGNAIQAGSAFIAQQFKSTHFDPPKVACAYNAGSLRRPGKTPNRWNMHQTPGHADRFVTFFNDCFALFAAGTEPMPTLSFYRLLSA
jgi:hypothetical protein